MSPFLQRIIVGLTSIAIIGHLSTSFSPLPAQAEEPDQNEAVLTVDRPFQLPFAQPAGLDSWLMAQPYGNTTGAYRQRFTTYGASGGIHFGVDLSAPCGTEVVAIADGTVFAVDGPYGSPPHNLMIDHPQLGYASMYGHLLEMPTLKPGRQVKQGEVIAYTGDSAELCYRRPHLHLEIRDLNHIRKYNPLALIDANWESLLLLGNSRNFARNLSNPRQWQSIYDQPEVRTAGPIVNDFEDTWPLDWSKRESASVMQVGLETAAPVQTSTTVALASTAVGRQITGGDCCTQLYWSDDSTQIRFIDRPGPEQPLGVWGVDVSQPGAAPQLITPQLALFSPDKSLMAYPDRVEGLAVVERLADGEQWTIDTQEHNLNFTPDGQGIIWSTYDKDAQWDTREKTLWRANVDGSNARMLYKARRTDPLAWVSNEQLLMSRGFPGTSDMQLFILSLQDGTETPLLQESRMRSMALSPNNRYLIYYIRFDDTPEKNGVWLYDLQNSTQPAQKLPFFGTYRWKDNDRLIYIPFDPEAGEHNFYEYTVSTRQTQPLFPNGTGLMIANNDWQISPDGGKIALLATDGTQLDGIWIVDLN